MSELSWQKSGVSDGGGECVEVATDHTGHLHLRESDTPDQVASADLQPAPIPAYRQARKLYPPNVLKGSL